MKKLALAITIAAFAVPAVAEAAPCKDANPQTKAVLLKHIPEMVNGLGKNAERASGMILKEMQDALKIYSPDALSDAKLAAINADLAKLPAAK